MRFATAPYKHKIKPAAKGEANVGNLNTFLDKYHTLIFDMDGVVTSEQSYWTAAALTVWEWLYKDEKLVAAKMCRDAEKIRARVFCNDRLISLLKGKGVNSNWDLTYVVYAACRILDTHDFNAVYQWCEKLGDNILDEYPIISQKLEAVEGCNCDRNGELWIKLHNTFQEWVMGDELYREKYNCEPNLCGKVGLLQSEKPVIAKDALIEVMTALKATGKRLAIATGRPRDELITPLKSFGVYDCFCKDGIITQDYVIAAEYALGQNLTKPHPYIFLKAMLGKDYSDEKIVNGEYDRNMIKDVLVIGDAGADILAAKAMGADFCAVLTGVLQKAGKEYFCQQQAEYILDSLAEFVDRGDF